MKKYLRRGSIMLLVIIFGAVFFMILMALSGFVLAQNRAQDVARGAYRVPRHRRSRIGNIIAGSSHIPRQYAKWNWS